MNSKVDHRIEVAVVGEGGESVKRDAFSPTTFENPIAPKSSSGSTGKAIAAKMITQAGSYFVSNYGNLSGDYIGQTRINEGIELAGLVGMALTGWAGAAAAIGAVAVRAANRYTNVKKSEAISNAMQLRTGLIRGRSKW
jgi:hypothetical protein